MPQIDYETALSIERRLLALSLRAKEIADASGLTRRQIAERMGLSSPSTVQRLVSGGMAYNATVETLMRFATACGYALVAELAPLRAPRASAAMEKGPRGALLSLAKYRERDTRWSCSGDDSLSQESPPDSSGTTRLLLG